MTKQIKSSIELAMEKMAKLPKLTKQEIRERQEREYRPLGQATARRFLTGDLAEARLEAELFKHQEERGEIVRTAFLEALCQSIDLENAEETARALEGIRLLVDDDRVDDAAKRLNGIRRDYERQAHRERAMTEEAAKAGVRDLGISGSAIRLNLQESESWRQKRGELQRAFRPRVDEIKRELTAYSVRSCSGR